MELPYVYTWRAMPVNSRQEANLRDGAAFAVTPLCLNSRESKQNRSTAPLHNSERVRSQLPVLGSTKLLVAVVRDNL